jgi:hypothetical protein
MSDDLVERVARHHYEQEIRREGEKPWDDLSPGVKKGFCGIASPFVALALEEAAKACEAELVGSFDQYSLGYNDGCKENAAAIRAMIPTGNAPAQNDNADSK